MDEIPCPGCQARLMPRQLHITIQTNTVTTEACPHCQQVIQASESTTEIKLTSRTVEDVAAIEGWFAQEGADGPSLAVTRLPTEQGHQRWQLARALPSGCQENWALEAEYDPQQPRVFVVRLVATGPEVLGEQVELLAAVFAEHGLQRHTSSPDLDDMFTRLAESPSGAKALSTLVLKPTPSTRWGPQTLLMTSRLPRGLLRGSVTRLVYALRDAETVQVRQASPRPAWEITQPAATVSQWRTVAAGGDNQEHSAAWCEP